MERYTSRRVQTRKNVAYVLAFIAVIVVMVVIAAVNPNFDGSALLVSGGVGVAIAAVGTILAYI